MTLRTTSSWVTIVLGALMIVAAAFTWFLVSDTLAQQNITVSGDAGEFIGWADGLAGDPVDGPITAYVEAQVIDSHSLEATNGLTYAEMERDDPLREVAMNASFLRASLFTSVVSFGVAAMAAAGGLMFILLGLGMRDVAEQTQDLRTRPGGAAQPA
jgi:hypothetical protein